MDPIVLTHDHDSDVCLCVPQVMTAKFDSTADPDLDGLLESNRLWSDAVRKKDPKFFEKSALGQHPKILWIGCSDSRVPENQVVQLGPGEMFVHRNIANVVCHSDLSCLSVLQYAVEVLKVQHIIVCGHNNCGGVAAALGNKQLGLIDNWLRLIKDVYQRNLSEFDGLQDEVSRVRKLVELNAINSAKNICHTSTVQNAWKNGQKLTVHAMIFDISVGRLMKLNWSISDDKALDAIYLSQ